MADYISREDAVQCADDVAVDFENDGLTDASIGAHTVGNWLKDMPAADVRPVVKARWYWDNYKYDWCCSNCFHPADHSIDKDDTYNEPSFKFCPHCGAMTGDNLDTTKGEA